MEEIDIREVLDFYKTKILFVIIIVLIFLLGGNIYSKYFKVLKYESSTKIVLVSSKGISSKAELSLNQDLVSDYSVVIKSDTTLNTVLENLNLKEKYTVEDLDKMINVSSVDGTDVINITVKSKSAKEAAYLVNEISDVFSIVVNDIYSLDNVYILDRGIESYKACNDNLLKDNVIYFLLGFVLSVGVLFIVFYFDDSIKNSEELEKKYGVVVIGNVPLEGGNK